MWSEEPKKVAKEYGMDGRTSCAEADWIRGKARQEGKKEMLFICKGVRERFPQPLYFTGTRV